MCLERRALLERRQVGRNRVEVAFLERVGRHRPVAAGKLIVTQGACASCHAVSGTAAKGAVGPALDGIANRKIGGVADFNAANVKKWVANPSSLKPGSSMPPYALKESYLDAIAAYLATLK
ncbi:MAG: hypothetical protein EB033_07970 [Proteobacteria bacterium]|nr:hypothetical protein [Pseudomonadota bacterium]NDF08564.1 hypothetical protein [Pseudomonadota bacterium]